jgi:hypothetical protein
MALGTRTALDERVAARPAPAVVSRQRGGIERHAIPSRIGGNNRGDEALNRFFSHLPNRIQIVQRVQLNWRAAVELIERFLIPAWGHKWS